MSNLSSSASESELWHVQLMNGVICPMTLEVLDDAFQEGVVDEDTYVCQEGDAAWRTLRDVAGLDYDDEDLEEVEPEPEYEDPYSRVSYAPPHQLQRPQQFQYSMGPRSTAPMASDIDPLDFDDEVDFRRSSKRPVLKWLAVAAAVGTIGIGATRYRQQNGSFAGISGLVSPARISGMISSATASFRAPTPTPPPPAPPPPVAAPVEPPAPPPAAVAAPVAAPVVAAAVSSTTPAVDTRLNDDTKRALLDADKGRTAKHKARVEQAHTSKPRPSSAANVFHKGGNKFDPLNSSL